MAPVSTSPLGSSTGAAWDSPAAAAPLRVEPPPVRPHQHAAPGWLQPLLARWQRWRDARLTSRDFQRRAASFWLTRPVARARARDLFDLVAGFVYSQVLAACVRLDLFGRLADGPRPIQGLAAELDLPPEACDRLLAAAVSLRLLEWRGEHHIGLGPLGAPLVGNTGVLAMIEHHAILYQDLGDPVALLRSPQGGRLSGYWAYATSDAPGALDADSVTAYSRLMDASQPLVADEVLDAVSLPAGGTLLDVGGGLGRFLIAAGRRHPSLRLMLFDLPGVVPGARRALAEAGMAERATVFGGDFTRDALPRGADVVSLVRVIYDHPDHRARQVLRAAYEALPPGGTLLVAEPMAGAAGAQRMGDAYFGMYLLAMGSGRSRSAEALRALVEEAGFIRVQERRTPLPLHVGVLTACKP